MCGIAGYFGNQVINKFYINNTMKLMANRGPDNQNFLQKKFMNKNLTLIHSRLSIIDINERSNQPMKFAQYLIIFNGEIYNYIELKKHLLSKGYNFTTKSDTEVLLKLYHLYQNRCFHFLEGMWAFAIYDIEKSNLILSRDKFGEKPLNILKTESGIFFGSEPKFIESLSQNRQSINYPKLFNYLNYGYNSVSVDTKTFKKNIITIKPAKIYSINNENIIQENEYWKPEIKEINIKKIKKKEIYSEIKFKLKEALKIRLRSDVKNIFCLSGGVDSGALVSIAAKEFNLNVNTFSIIDSFSKKYNEKDLIEHTARDVSAKKNYLFTENINLFSNLENVIKYYQAPVLTVNYLLHALMQKKISNLGYKVVLSGNGADEIFAGYYDHYLYHLKDLKNFHSKDKFEKNFASWKTHLYPIIRNPDFRDFYSYYAGTNKVTLKEDFKILFKKNYSINPISFNQYKSDLKNKMLSQIPERLYPVLFMDDINSMMSSIENRTPFLDKNLINYIFSLPSEIFIQNGYSKNLLRQSTKGILNNKIRTLRRKYGFNASLSSFKDFNKIKYIEYIFDNIKYLKDFIYKDKLFSLIKKSNFNDMSDAENKFYFRLLSSTIFLSQNS